jgi:phosphoglycolate phosphatase
VTRLAILDLDGTLVDSVDDLGASVNHALAALGLPSRSTDEIRSFVGEGARVLLARAISPRDEPRAGAGALARSLRRALPRPDAALPGPRAALAGAGRVLAVHTNKPGALSRKILAGLGVAGRFAAIVGGDDAPRSPIPPARSRSWPGSALPRETVFIGDSRVDAATARAAGVALVAVTWGSARAPSRAAGATVFVDDAAELARFLS